MRGCFGCLGVIVVLSLVLTLGYYAYDWAFGESAPVEVDASENLMDIDFEMACKNRLKDRAPAFTYPLNGATNVTQREGTDIWVVKGDVEYQGQFRARYTCVISVTAYDDGTYTNQLLQMDSPGFVYP